MSVHTHTQDAGTEKPKPAGKGIALKKMRKKELHGAPPHQQTHTHT